MNIIELKTESTAMRELAAQFYSAGHRLNGMFGQYMTEHKAKNGPAILIADSGMFSAYAADGQMVCSGTGLNAMKQFLGMRV